MGADLDKLKPGGQLDRFHLEKQLGSGAFGQVWLAVDEGSYGFKKRVALKILIGLDDDKKVESLMREARLVGALHHPNIVDVYGVMKLEELSFIVMEVVDGDTLEGIAKNLAKLRVPFPRAVVLDIGIGICEALHHAWKAKNDAGERLKIVHRDLKPANVMISNRGSVKVADFGIAKACTDVNMTKTGMVKGTPSYLAPELWAGTRDFRPPVDLFSLGVILWELCTASRFYGDAGLAEIFDIIHRRSPKEEAMEAQAYYPELVPLLTELLQRKPDDRPQDSLVVAERLRELRRELGPTGDMAQFVRIINAQKAEGLSADESEAAIPVLPTDATDWLELVSAITDGTKGRGMPTQDLVLANVSQLGPSTSSNDSAPAAVSEGVEGTRTLERPAQRPPPAAPPVSQTPDHQPLDRSDRKAHSGPAPVALKGGEFSISNSMELPIEPPPPAARQSNSRLTALLAVAIAVGATAVAGLLWWLGS